MITITAIETNRQYELTINDKKINTVNNSITKTLLDTILGIKLPKIIPEKSKEGRLLSEMRYFIYGNIDGSLEKGKIRQLSKETFIDYFSRINKVENMLTTISDNNYNNNKYGTF